MKTYSEYPVLDAMNALRSRTRSQVPMQKNLLTREGREIVKLRAQIERLVKDIKAADALLTSGDDSGALAQVRIMASRASQSYLDCVGRAAVKPNVTGAPFARAIEQYGLEQRYALLYAADQMREAIAAERDRLRASLDDWLYANGPNGWIDALRDDAGRYRKLRSADMTTRNRLEHYSDSALDVVLDALPAVGAA